ncbi:hypothetical protein evm_004664 [Chilo suppressalis]|nr:hypothetical protein evm_004664 [Chilo suppressalis]
MSTNGINSEDVDTSECDGEKVVTMMDVLQEQEEFEEDANAVLGASDDKNCTYTKGYIKRQAIYACLTCCDEARSDPSKRAGVCLACSLTCHENHELIELYTKRNFRCDCGNPKFNSNPCQFVSSKTELNEDNKYNQNFSGLYCTCHRPYPDPENPIDDEMIQCIVCEDWLHSAHLEAVVPTNEQYAEMICKECMDKNDFLHDYSDLAVNTESTEVDIVTSNGTGVTTTDINTESNRSENQVLLNGTTESSETNNDKENKEEMDVDSSIKETTEDKMVSENASVKESNAEVNEENVNEKEEESPDRTQESTYKPKETGLEASNIDETMTSGTDNTEKLDEINTGADPNSTELPKPDTVQASDDKLSGNESIDKVSDNVNSESNEPESTSNTLNVNLNESSNLASESEKDNEQLEEVTPENVTETEEVDKSNTDSENKELDSKETEELVSNNSEDENGHTNDSHTNENIEMETCENKAESPEKAVLDSVDESKLNSVDESKLDSVEESKSDSVEESKSDSVEESKLDSTDDSKLNSVEEPTLDSVDKSKINSINETIDESNKVNDNEENMESTEPTSTENEDIEMKDDNVSDKVENNSMSMPLESEVATHKEDESESAAVESINVGEAESLSTKNEDEIKSVPTAQSGTESVVDENGTGSAPVENEVTLNTGDQSSDKIDQNLEDSEVLPNIQENKRKLSTEQSDTEANMPKKAKLEESKQCVKPKHIERRFKGATFWPSNFRQKLCTCNECISMYKDLSVLFLIDPEDTVTAYETLGKEKINGTPASQYEKGLEALSSLDRIQQINALTEYNKMRDKLLDFLKSFKDRKEVVKEEDIKAFFAGMKPKREPDGVYFCR